MKKKITVIYIPGLGDEKSRGQDLALNLFRPFGIKGYYFPIGWKSSGDYEAKLRELDELITELYKSSSVHLFAASAGASAAINSYSRNLDKVSSVSLVCGKIRNIDKIHPDYYAKNPNFKLSVEMLAESLTKLNQNSRAKILSVRIVRSSILVKPIIAIDALNFQFCSS